MGFATDEFNGPWALFSTGTTGTALQVRTNLTDGGTSNDETLAGDWLGTPHRYRIVWGADAVTFFIDGVRVASHPVTISGPMRVAASDYNVGGGGVTVDDLVLSPYATSGTFTSRVLDTGAHSELGVLDADASTARRHCITYEVRNGDTAAPDGTWTAWSPITPGSAIAASGPVRAVPRDADDDRRLGHAAAP